MAKKKLAAYVEENVLGAIEMNKRSIGNEGWGRVRRRVRDVVGTCSTGELAKLIRDHIVEKRFIEAAEVVARIVVSCAVEDPHWPGRKVEEEEVEATVAKYTVEVLKAWRAVSYGTPAEKDALAERLEKAEAYLEGLRADAVEPMESDD